MVAASEYTGEAGETTGDCSVFAVSFAANGDAEFVVVSIEVVVDCVTGAVEDSAVVVLVVIFEPDAVLLAGAMDSEVVLVFGGEEVSREADSEGTILAVALEVVAVEVAGEIAEDCCTGVLEEVEDSKVVATVVVLDSEAVDSMSVI